MKRISPAVLLVAFPLAAFGQGKPCDLASPADIEAALGAKPTLSASTLPNGVEMCSGKAGSSTVTVRRFKRTADPSGEKEKAGIEMLKKMGATVEVKKFGPITCLSAAPGGQLAGHGFTTSCTAAKPPMFAVIEVADPKAAVSMDKLRPVAEKMMTRF